MQRSSSSSHIPLPLSKNDVRPRSKSSVRSSGRESGQNATKRGSTDKIPVLKRSNSSTNFKKSLLVTPSLQTGTSGKKYASNLNTPASTSRSSSTSRSRSPYRPGSAKSDRNITDKKWVSEQYAKVRYYLQEHTNFQDHIPDIKPPTINTFVYIMQLLVKEFDARVNLTVANYKEEVVNFLKMLRYPGNISNSLMKSVNTMDVWPEVISIFAWLIDLIAFIKRAEQPTFEPDVKQQKAECVFDHIAKKYLAFNNREDQNLLDEPFVETYMRILNIDKNEIVTLNKEVAELKDLTEKQTAQIKGVQKENDLLKKECDVKYEIDTLCVDAELKHDDINHEIEFLKQRKVRLDQGIKEKQLEIQKLTEAMANQPCTYEEKVQLETRVDQLIHTLDLQKERLAVKRELKASCDAEFAEAMKRVESEVYRLNNELIQLANVDPELKILQLRENNFISKDFINEIQAVIKNKNVIEKKVIDRIETMMTSISQCKNINEKLKLELEAKEKEIQELNMQEYKADESIKAYEIKIQNLKDDSEKQRKLLTEKIKELDETMPNIVSLEQEVIRLQELRVQENSNIIRFVKNYEDICDKFSEKIVGNLENLKVLLNTINEHFQEKLSEVTTEQENIYTELEQLLPTVYGEKKE